MGWLDRLTHVQSVLLLPSLLILKRHVCLLDSTAVEPSKNYREKTDNKLNYFLCPCPHSLLINCPVNLTVVGLLPVQDLGHEYRYEAMNIVTVLL